MPLCDQLWSFQILDAGWLRGTCSILSIRKGSPYAVTPTHISMPLYRVCLLFFPLRTDLSPVDERRVSETSLPHVRSNVPRLFGQNCGELRPRFGSEVESPNLCSSLVIGQASAVLHQVPRPLLQSDSHVWNDHADLIDCLATGDNITSPLARNSDHYQCSAVKNVIR